MWVWIKTIVARTGVLKGDSDMKVIRFRRLSTKPEIVYRKVRVGTIHCGVIEYLMPVRQVQWEIALNEAQLWAKLDGEMAEIVMPAKSWMVQLWRYFFPLKGIECVYTERSE